MPRSVKRSSVCHFWIVAMLAMLGISVPATRVYSQDICTWRPVETARINSHQLGPPWCYPGEFMTAFDLDGPRNYAPHNSPVVGQALCCTNGPNSNWGGNPQPKLVWQRGLNSHQYNGPEWCDPGSFIVALDLDGPRELPPHDSPVVGAVLCASIAGGYNPSNQPFWQELATRGLNTHQPYGRWCPDGSYLVSFDQDSERAYAANDSPVIGRAQCRKP